MVKCRLARRRAVGLNTSGLPELERLALTGRNASLAWKLELVEAERPHGRRHIKLHGADRLVAEGMRRAGRPRRNSPCLRHADPRDVRMAERQPHRLGARDAWTAREFTLEVTNCHLRRLPVRYRGYIPRIAMLQGPRCHHVELATRIAEGDRALREGDIVIHRHLLRLLSMAAPTAIQPMPPACTKPLRQELKSPATPVDISDDVIRTESLARAVHRRSVEAWSARARGRHRSTPSSPHVEAQQAARWCARASEGHAPRSAASSAERAEHSDHARPRRRHHAGT